MAKSVSRFFNTISNKFFKRSKRGGHSKVIKAETIQFAYDVLIRFKEMNIQQYKSAVGMLIAHIEIKKGTLSSLEADIDKFTRFIEDIKKKLESTTTELKEEGKSEEEVKQHPDYIRLTTSYKEFETTIDEKKNRLKTIQQELESLHNRIEVFKRQMVQLHRDLVKIQEEQSETIIDIRSKRHEKEIADILAGDS